MISFSQTTYNQKIVEHFRMEDAKPLSVPINPRHNLTKSQPSSDPQGLKEMKHIPYREAMGSLMCVVIGTQPDIAYTMSYLAIFMANPGHSHCKAVMLSIQNYVVFFLVFLLFSPCFYNHSFLYYHIWKDTFYIWFWGRTHAWFVTRGNHM